MIPISRKRANKASHVALDFHCPRIDTPVLQTKACFRRNLQRVNMDSCSLFILNNKTKSPTPNCSSDLSRAYASGPMLSTMHCSVKKF